MSAHRVAIAGAGMAGTSLACALATRGFGGEIVLIDERTQSDAARTWCWWDVPGVPFREYARHRYPAWRIATRDRDVVRGSPLHPYLCLQGSDFYAAAHARLRDCKLRRIAGERVAQITESTNLATLICASGRSVEADVAIDARGAGPPKNGAFAQRFVGNVVRVRDSVFEPGIATLMDFRIGTERPVHFTYVLPFAADTALIEDTVFTTRAADDAARIANVERYVKDVLHTEIVACESRERGALPLGGMRLPKPTRRIAAVGGAGGAIRPSSGYAFVRTQRHAHALAEAIVSGSTLPALPTSRRQRILDAALSMLLRGGIVSAARFFPALFARSEPAALARFLSDASLLRDDARILSALLPYPA